MSEVAPGHGCHFGFEINGSKESYSWNQEQNHRMWIGRRGGNNGLIIRFDSAERINKFMDDIKAQGFGCTVPINTGKHIYSNWTHIINKVGALNPLMDPFKMEANKHIVPDYTVDMCPKTLDLLARSAYIMIRPEWTVEERENILTAIKKALA